MLLVCLIVASAVLCWVTAADEETSYRAYYGTDTRAAEILVGALLAVVDRLGWKRNAQILSYLGIIAMAGVMVIWSAAEVSSPWLYQGGFTAYALLSAILIEAAGSSARNPIRTLLSTPFMLWLGRVSYGAYVYHWPIFLFLDPWRTNLPLYPLFALRCAVTLAVATVSYRFFEEPIRYGRSVFSDRRVVVLGALLLASTVVVVGLRDAEWGRGDGMGDPPDVSTARSQAGPVVSMFGDSAALTLLPAVGRWLRRHDVRTVAGSLDRGCSIVDVGMRLARPGWSRVPRSCRDVAGRWRGKVAESRANIAVVLSGVWDCVDRRLPGSSTVYAMGSPKFDAVFRESVIEVVHAFDAMGVTVIWLTMPRLRFDEADPPFDARSASDPMRVRRYNEILMDVGSELGGRMRIIDLAAFMERLPGGSLDREVREDGIHFTRRGRQVVTKWLGPEVLRVTREVSAE